jgi:succinate dehydrogenase / fumarate reductase, cytochrome b subunit
MSLDSQQSFTRFKGVFAHWAVKLIVLGLVWAYLHHLFAGLRHLALDAHYGVELPAARATSGAVMAVSLVLTLVVGALIW